MLSMVVRSMSVSLVGLPEVIPALPLDGSAMCERTVECRSWAICEYLISDGAVVI